MNTSESMTRSAACRRVLTMLLYWNADALVFRQSHWKCSAEELVEQLRQLSSGSPFRGARASGPGPAVQVRQPVHTRSIGAWERHSAKLARVTDEFAKAGML